MLDKAVYLVYDALSDNEKKDAQKVKKALEIAFAPSAAESYRRFVARKMQVKESVDGYVADLKRLLTMSDHNVVSSSSSSSSFYYFTRGVPTDRLITGYPRWLFILWAKREGDAAWRQSDGSAFHRSAARKEIERKP